MNIAHREPMTQEEFFDWAGAQEGRYEFDGFQPVAMVGGTGNHARIIRNINFQLTGRLGDGPCEALASDAGIQTVGNRIRYPDGVVTCKPFDGTRHIVPEPVIVFEVVSASSARDDRNGKLREYHAVPSIRRYVLVEQSVMVLTVFSRQGAQPWSAVSLGEGDTLVLPEIGVEIPVSDIYRRVDFAEPGVEQGDG
ncbi:Uma2 family endonuclease [Lichenicola cladoniae]|uniref:Uma2 family endonuclease n=1 Tax=Lichenicola cladoniae TaxID=1484109 RepID=A0A6M8HMZ8_9PROT|nr:Uma2 family endonuclease [Lichenicola cladoniae]NPD67214.1 Uma2 family endonuclease [Acetobacteraceae bacterium]QKE89728.1 Uma2 family endonuclease [Lichenicola cladoniae]